MMPMAAIDHRTFASSHLASSHLDGWSRSPLALPIVETNVDEMMHLNFLLAVWLPRPLAILKDKAIDLTKRNPVIDVIPRRPFEVRRRVAGNPSDCHADR